MWQIWSWDQNHVHEQGQFSLMGQSFSWLQQGGHELEQQGARRQRAGNLRNAVRRLLVKKNVSDFACRTKAKAKPQGRNSASSSTRTVLNWRKNLDRCWTRIIFNLRLWSVEEIDSYSSSRKSTQRRSRSDWILENQRQSSETFHVLSLVWRSGRRAWREEEETKTFPVLDWFVRSNLVPLQGYSGRSLIDLALQLNVITIRPKLNSNDFGLISRFEFDFRHCGFFCTIRIGCSKFNHTQCGRTCACTVACLCPNNSISSVVVSVTTFVYVQIFLVIEVWERTRICVCKCICICSFYCTCIFIPWSWKWFE